MPGPLIAAGDPPEASGSEPFLKLEVLNPGLPPLARPPDLETPQAALENFDFEAARGDFDRASRSLDLNGYSPARQAEAGRALAKQLKAVMDREIWFRWDEFPDTPDGRQDDQLGTGSKDGQAPGPRSSIFLGRAFIGDVDHEVRLQRVKPAKGEPVWVFSRRTVAQVPALYRAFGPSRLEAYIPAALKRSKFAMIEVWQWIGFGVILTAGGVLGWLVQGAALLAIRWRDSAWTRTVAEAIRGPGAMTDGLAISAHLARRFLGLAGPVLSVLEPVYLALMVGGLAWFLQRLIGLLAGLISRRYEAHDTDEANVLLTRIVVARHLLTFLVLLVGAGYALSRFEWVRRVGPTFLASAGVAGVVLGVAAQRTLGNLFAGLLLAVTQPVKTGDAILFEGEFGWIEDIAINYLVIRVWDLRRIVVPITHFLDKPIQNWSRGSQSLMMPVYFHADYHVDVAAARAELEAILESTDLWDRSVPPILQVTGSGERSIELRALCSAGDPTSSWNLQSLVRERMVDFLRRAEGGRNLPHLRVATLDEAATAHHPNGTAPGDRTPDHGKVE